MMNKVQLIMMASVAIVMGAVSCKTVEKVEMKNEDYNPVTQVEIKDLQSLSDDMLQGQWLFTSAMGKPVVVDEVAYIIMDVKSQRVYGNNGCNTFNATLTLGENCAMAFTDCITTMKACRPDVTEGNVMEALGRTTYYNVIHNGHEMVTIDLLDSTGSTVATLSRQMRELLNGRWDIVEVDGMKIKLDAMPEIVIDIDENKFTGNSACNIMNGGIVVDAAKVDNKIAFTGVLSTRRMCAPDAMAVEDKVLAAINQVASFRILDDSRVALYGNTSQYAIMILQRK